MCCKGTTSFFLLLTVVKHAGHWVIKCHSEEELGSLSLGHFVNIGRKKKDDHTNKAKYDFQSCSSQPLSPQVYNIKSPLTHSSFVVRVHPAHFVSRHPSRRRFHPTLSTLLPPSSSSNPETVQTLNTHG